MGVNNGSNRGRCTPQVLRVVILSFVWMGIACEGCAPPPKKEPAPQQQSSVPAAAPSLPQSPSQSGSVVPVGPSPPASANMPQANLPVGNPLPVALQEPKPTTHHQIGETFTLGKMNYLVETAWWSDAISDDPAIDYPPYTSYLFVQFLTWDVDGESPMKSGENPRSGPRYILAEDDKPIPPSGQESKNVKSKGELVPDDPTMTKRRILAIFDVPKGHSYRIEFSGSFFKPVSLAHVQITDLTKGLDLSAETEKKQQERLGKTKPTSDKSSKVGSKESQAAKLEAIESRKTRTWTSADGKFKTEAKYVSIASGKVKLIRSSDEKEILVPLASLCEEDQAFIKNKGWLNAEN